jgi:hypothetical protein
MIEIIARMTPNFIFERPYFVLSLIYINISITAIVIGIKQIISTAIK